MKSKYLRLRVPEGEGSEVIEYESKEPFFGYKLSDIASATYRAGHTSFSVGGKGYVAKRNYKF